MNLYLTKWPASISIEKDELLLTENLHQGFVEAYNDGEATSLRIYYLENGEERLERECIEISDLERAEDSSGLVFRICKLKSGVLCNDHVLIKPERSKDCHTIYYAFRYLQQKPTKASKPVAQKQSTTIRKHSLVKQIPSFQQISVTRKACNDKKTMERKGDEKIASSSAKNDGLKRKVSFHPDVLLCSPTKKSADEPQKEQKPVKGIIVTGKNDGSPERETANVDDTALGATSRQSSPDLSASFERLSAGTDSISSKGFMNLGNSCYMNAVLQGLFHVKPFKELLNLVTKSSKNTEYTVLNALNTLRRKYQKVGTAKKRRLLENVIKYLDDRRFEMALQEDAQEFLTLVLDKIDSELGSLAGSIKIDEHGQSESVMSVSSIFGFEMKHRIFCRRCDNEEEKCEKGMFVPAEIIHNKNATHSLSVQILVDNCLKSEKIEHVCPECGERYATMNHEFRCLPRCLIVFLKRYEYKRSSTNQKQRKRNDTVELSKCIHLVFRNEKHLEDTKSSGSSSDQTPSSGSSSSDDKESIVQETPPEDLDFDDSMSGSGSGSETGERSVQGRISKTVKHMDDCGDGKSSSSTKVTDKASVTPTYDSNANKKLHSMMFCRPRPDFCERACALLNIAQHRPSSIWKEPKPLSEKSMPSNVIPIESDGNCLFRSIAFYIAGNEDEHLNVRRSVVDFEEKYGNALLRVLHTSEDDWEEHVRKMANDGEWGTETELFAFAALLDAEIWTFLDGKWLRYRPLFRIDDDGTVHEIPIEEYEDNRKDAIFLINRECHFRPVLDVSQQDETVCDYQLAAVVSHKGMSPSRGHYVCDVRNRNKNTWTHFDDNFVVQIPETRVLPECARDGYIFFYVAGSGTK